MARDRRAVMQLIAGLVMAAGWRDASGGALGGYILERDADVAVEEPGTHKGGGRTIGYSLINYEN